MEQETHLMPPRLRRGRMHEVCGRAALGFGIMAAARETDPIFWIENPAQPERLCPQGLLPYLDPERVVLVRPRNRQEALWCMEECLRSVATVTVAALAEPARLLESRRLQLAAEEGEGIGLCIIPDKAEGNAAETRWRSTPLVAERGGATHRWELLKNKRGMLGTWDVRWNARNRALTVMSAPKSVVSTVSNTMLEGRGAMEAFLKQHS